MLKKDIIKKIIFTMMMVLFVTAMPINQSNGCVWAKTVKITPKSKSIRQGKSFKIKIKNAKSKIKISVSKKSIIKIKKIKKGIYRVTGKKAGKVSIAFKIGKKKYKCKVTVKKLKNKPTSPTKEEIIKTETAEQETTIPSHTHKYIEIDRCESGCGTDGYILYECSCGNTKKEVINKIREHVISSWIIDKMPTYQETGLKHKECVLCHNKLEEKEIAKLPEKTLENFEEMTDEDDEIIDVEEAFK